MPLVTPMIQRVGTHYLVEFIGCDLQRMNDSDLVEKALVESVRVSGATYLSHSIHKFSPHGLTLVALIAESHFALHTWPEYRYMSFDILTCGTMDAQKAIDYLATQFGVQEVRKQTVERGF